MRRTTLWLVLAFTLVSATSASAQAVAVAQLSGSVLDQSNAALPGVDVTVMQTDTGLNRSAITNEQGGFTFPNLPVGPYKLTVKLQGFNTFEQTGIVLSVGDTRS